MKFSAAPLLLFASPSVAFSPSSIETRNQSSNRNSLLNQRPSLVSSHDKVHLRARKALSLLFASKIGIFFGTSTGSTEEAAALIAAEFGNDADEPIEIDTIQGSVAKKFDEYDALIVGTPTWNTGADTERSGTGWDEIYYGEMKNLNIAGKKVAVFGLGDQISYSENYADGSGELHDVFEKLGCQMLGYTSQEGYEHDASKAIRGEKFCGLLLDAVNQEEMTADRVAQWVEQLTGEGILEGGGGKAITATTPTSAVDDAEDALAKLEKENAELRKMLEENSRLLEENILAQPGNAYTPHYNDKTGITMWTSPDGRTCYYTMEAPKTP